MMALTAGSVLTLVAAAWLFRQAGGILLLGGIVGVLVVAGVPTVRAALRPIGALGRASAPLGLTVLVFVAAGTVKSPPLLQLAVGLVALLIAWYGLIQREWDFPNESSRGAEPLAGGTVRHAIRQVAGVALPAVIVGAVLTYATVPVLDALEEAGQASAFLFLVAVLLFASAVVLRLVGYGRTRLRALITIAVGLALVRLGMEGGVFPGHDIFSGVAPWLTADFSLLVAGGAVVLVGLVEIPTTILLTRDAADGLSGVPARVAAAMEAPVVKRSITDRIGGWGLVAAGLAALALLLSVVAAATVGGAKEQFDEVTLKPIKPGQPSRAPSDVTDDQELAEMYSPVLVFTEQQRWSPTKVDSYLAAAEMEDWEGRVRTAPPVDELPDECPGIVLKPCYELTIGCESAADDCAMSRKAKLGEARRDEAVYVRVERREDWEPSGDLHDGSPNPFDNGGRFRAATKVLLQYWYFYPYDEWVAPVLGGQQFKQRHEADWEAVTIGLGDSGPLYVAYSQHCGGAWSAWDDIHVANNESPRLHPLVAVAEGSQANYRVAEERRAPDWAKCAGVPADTLTLLSYASNIRDQTDSKWSWTPAEHLLVTAETPPMSFLGRWGPYSRTTLENFRTDQRLGKDQQGPSTPTLQRLWQRPMQTIFGGGNWHHE